MISKLKKFVAVSCMALMLLANTGSVFASDVNSENLNKYKVESLHGMMTEGEIQPAWLGYGPITRYPAEGGTWEYGFWNAKVRSYYTVKRCHGSTVKLNDKTSRSIDTASGYTSKAELWAIQHNGNDRYYYRVCR
ncbi:TPA: lactococcin 972 family bacteriocin [Streptococcus suis]|nr:lactococcin 972 family bacteriocin [Streptococcus suis]HEL1760024.1 lactococcin 972 family bacteriocin [Streptococcus suis]HEM5563023.1 lactococcin 972 family bacteriocin [Streptococcus suis]